MTNGVQETPTARVLIIDSDNVRRGMLACTLPATRYSLEFASSPAQGLDLMVRQTPDVVIVGGDGDASDLCQRVRSLPAGTACTLVLMDERYRDEDVGRAEAVAVGADIFLPFPFEAEMLAERLETEEPRSKPTPLTTASVQEPAVVGTKRRAQQDAAARPLRGSEDVWQTFADEVRQIHEKINSVDYYRLLQMPRNASANAIKEAYFRCSMAYHPDRFMRLENQELKSQIYEIFKRMSEAFKVLVNSESRARYDENLAGPGRQQNLRLVERDRPAGTPKDPTVDARTAAGKKYLHYAILAQSEGKHRSARMYLSMALQYEPDNEALQFRLEEVTKRL